MQTDASCNAASDQELLREIKALQNHIIDYGMGRIYLHLAPGTEQAYLDSRYRELIALKARL